MVDFIKFHIPEEIDKKRKRVISSLVPVRRKVRLRKLKSSVKRVKPVGLSDNIKSFRGFLFKNKFRKVCNDISAGLSFLSVSSGGSGSRE